MRHLFLLSQPRSGTSYFDQLLRNANGPFHFATLAEAIYNPHLLQTSLATRHLRDLIGSNLEKFCIAEALQQDDGFDLGFFKGVIAQYHHDTAQNSPIQAKWFPSSIERFTEVLKKRGQRLSIPLLNDIFGEITWIEMYRENLIKQAVSFDIAFQTKQWIKFRQEAFNSIDTLEALYDFDAILCRVRLFASERLFWPVWMKEMGIQSSYTMTYEQLTGNYVKTLTELSEKTGLPIDIPTPDQIQIVPQSNELNGLFIARFKADCDSRGIDASVWENAAAREHLV